MYSTYWLVNNVLSNSKDNFVVGNSKNLTHYNDFFVGSKSDIRDGFIHLSTSEQLKETLEKHYKLKSPLYLLEVETDDLEIEWEISRNNQLFPHLYEPLPLSTVTNIYRIIVAIFV